LVTKVHASDRDIGELTMQQFITLFIDQLYLIVEYLIDNRQSNHE